MPRAIAILAALIFASAVLARGPAPLPGAEGRVSLGAFVEVLEDPTGNMRLADVRRPEHAQRFAPAASDPLNFGYSRSAWWLRFSLPGGAPAGEELILEIAFPSIDRIELRRARTLGELTTAAPKVIWRKHPHGPMGAHIWAPEIHFLNGKWYVYFAAGDAEAIWNIRMYVLENNSPNPLEGTWTEKGQIKMNWESFTLDATTFENRGTHYLVWAQSGQDPKITGTGIYIAKMDTPWSISTPAVLLSKPDLPWEQVRYWVNEGPTVLQRNGRLFLTYSAFVLACLWPATARLLATLSKQASSEPEA